MQFAQPNFLYGLSFIPLALLFILWIERRRRITLARLGDTALVQTLSASLNRRGRTARSVLQVLALTLIIFSLARPQWGTEVQVVEQKGVQVMLVLDVSPSMLAQDVKPDRLQRAKLVISELMDALDGDEIGLVLFSGSSFLQFPLTTDLSTARSLVDAARPEAISRQGTAIGEAVETALRSFNAKRASAKTLILLTDGEDHTQTTMDSVRKAAGEEVLVYAVGIGTPQGAPIPLTDEQGQVSGFLKDRSGQVVVSRLDEPFLQSLAQAGGGKYYRAGASGAEVQALATEIGRLKQAELDKRFSRQPLERFQYFLLAAFLCLLAAELIPERARSKRTAAAVPNLTLLLLAGFFGLGLGACSPSAEQLNHQANQAYASHKYDQALQDYAAAGKAKPDAPEPQYNAANTYYRQGDFAQAQEKFSAALEKAGQELAQAAYYNLGNAFYQAGQLDKAAAAYIQALRLKPDDADAKHNLELALQKKEEQKQQQQQSQPQPTQDPKDSHKDQQASNGQPTQSPSASQQSQATQASPQPGQQGQPTPAAGPTQAVQGLTPEQARQLLESAARDAQSLQDALRDQAGVSVQPLEENW